jgi:hypothetical protein
MAASTIEFIFPSRRGVGLVPGLSNLRSLWERLATYNAQLYEQMAHAVELFLGVRPVGTADCLGTPSSSMAVRRRAELAEPSRYPEDGNGFLA